MIGINTFNISDQEVLKILQSEEGHFCDLKAKEIRPSKLSESLSAFANAEGGELFVGILEKKREQFRLWNGFSKQEEANGHIQLFEELFPLGGGCTLSFLHNTNQKGWILKVELQKSRDIKKASSGKVYVRRGAQNLPITTQERLKILRRDKGITSFETETVPADQIIITNSETIIKFMIEVVPSSEPEVWLKKQQLLIGP
jgi:ATP-dependent DNA helicase RecG